MRVLLGGFCGADYTELALPVAQNGFKLRVLLQGLAHREKPRPSLMAQKLPSQHM